MKLIADSGSTKTDWCVASETGVTLRVKTQGINPFHQQEHVILDILRNELLPQLESIGSVAVSEIHFYGSGCNEANAVIMRQLLEQLFGIDKTFVHSDLLAAARAVCGQSAGIACILGTGVNSCLYDGTDIVRNTRPLGYILGDEGSGAVLGKLFVNALYKGFLPETIVAEFEAWISMGYQDIITRVYREPMANRFLASIAHFIHLHMDIPAVRRIVIENFRDFFRRNIVQYCAAGMPVGAVGSIAWFFQNELRKAATLEGFTVSRVLQSPMDGLLEYHG